MSYFTDSAVQYHAHLCAFHPLDRRDERLRCHGALLRHDGVVLPSSSFLS